MSRRSGVGRRAAAAGAAFIAVLTVGCRAGNNPSLSPAARSPGGVLVEPRQADRMGVRVTAAELLGFGERGAYLLRPGSVMLYPFGSPFVLIPRESPPRMLALGAVAAGDAQVEAFANYARYPFGIDEALLDRLLDALGIDEVGSPPGTSQPSPGNLETFLSDLQSSGRRFEDLSVAVGEGYRLLGPDFPGMGEHWIHPGLVIAGGLDPTRPPVLGYTRLNGERRLISFAFTRVLGPGDRLPEGPFPLAAWHDHTGGVDEESLLLSGPMSDHGGHDAFRLSMVHVWTGAENPDGILAQNNWALPFVRLGIPHPPDVGSDAARALSLASAEGRSFYAQLLDEGAGLDGHELARASHSFDRAARASEHVSERALAEGRVSPEHLQALEGVWSDLWRDLEATLDAASQVAIRALR